MATSALVAPVQSALNDVIFKNFKSTPEVTVAQGCASGDGYSSKTYSINLKGEGKDFDIFVKYMPQNKVPSEQGNTFKDMFLHELKFYGEVCPAMLKFQEERQVEKPFNNVAKHYTANVSDLDIPPVLMENIRVMGYTLRDKRKSIDDKHIILALKTFAKFHAVSYALKDQNRELFEQLEEGTDDIFPDVFKLFGLNAIIIHSIEAIKDVIDPDTDKELVDILPTLGETLVSFVTTTNEHVDEYAVITQGDCWSNNMMFLYDEKTGDPIDVKLLDWQMLRVNSPVLDVAYFFYSVATKSMLDDLDGYMKYYHDELSIHMTILGSDPEVLYPFEVFEQHWKKFSKFGLAMSLLAVKGLLFEDGEVPNTMAQQEIDIADSFGANIKHQNTYNKIIVDLLRHFVARGFI